MILLFFPTLPAIRPGSQGYPKKQASAKLETRMKRQKLWKRLKWQKGGRDGGGGDDGDDGDPHVLGGWEAQQLSDLLGAYVVQQRYS